MRKKGRIVAIVKNYNDLKKARRSSAGSSRQHAEENE